MKIRVITNYRVVVWPDFIMDPEEMAARRTLREIKRHIDMRSAELMWDDDTICEFCKSKWEEDAGGCPLCCNKAVAEWEGRQTGDLMSEKVSKGD